MVDFVDDDDGGGGGGSHGFPCSLANNFDIINLNGPAPFAAESKTLNAFKRLETGKMLQRETNR